MISKKVELVSFEKIKSSYKILSDIEINDKYLVFNYLIQGDMSSIKFKDTKCKARKWELWTDTCFEAFLKYPKKKWYIEFNFSTDGSWNCFYLSGYRKKCIEFQAIENVVVDINTSEQKYELKAIIKLSEIKDLSNEDLVSGKILVGLSTIIKNRSNEILHYAIKHSENSPDFHDEFNFKKDLFKSTSA